MTRALNLFGDDRLPERLALIVDSSFEGLNADELAAQGILIRTPDKVLAVNLPADITIVWMRYDLDPELRQKICFELKRLRIPDTKIIRGHDREVFLRHVTTLPNRPTCARPATETAVQPRTSIRQALIELADVSRTCSDQLEYLHQEMHRRGYTVTRSQIQSSFQNLRTQFKNKKSLEL